MNKPNLLTPIKPFTHNRILEKDNTLLSLKNYILLIFLLFSISKSYAQPYIINGLVTEESGEPIQFAYVFANNDSTDSYFTDINGRFAIRWKESLKTLTVNYHHYTSYVLSVNKNTPDSLSIILYRNKDIENNKTSGLYIIEKLVANKQLHNPEKQGGTFRYYTYSKSTVDLFQIENHKVSKRFENVIQGDSLFQMHHRTSGNQHVEVSEFMTERYFKYPNKDHEKIHGYKETGLHDRQLTALNSNLHPISFYENYFDFLGARYASPIGEETYQKYDFQLQSKYYSGNDTLFVITFEPSKLRTTGLSGIMYVNSNQYAVQNITVSPVQYELVDFEIAQKSDFIENSEWFPTQINHLYFVDKYPKKYLGTVYEKKTYIKNIELNPKVNPNDYGVELVLMDHFATKRDEGFWDSHRIEPLSKREKKTYLRVDSLRHKSAPANIIKRISAFYNQNLYYELSHLTLNNLFQINKYEGLRAGLAGSLGKNLLRVFEFNGYGAYGFRDRAWKWGAGGGFFLNEKHDMELSFLHKNDIEEPGTINYLKKEKDFFRSIFTDRMDKVETNEVFFTFRSPNYHLFELGLQTVHKTPIYSYQFQVNDDNNIPVLSNSFEVAEVIFRTRYAANEKISNMLGSASRLESFAPILFLNYARGFSGFLNGEFDYHKLSALVDYKFNIGHLGTTDISIEAGIIDGNLPYSFLFNGKGSNLSTSSVIVQDHFQTMGLYEFVSDKFLNIFFSHDFGSKLFAHARFRPDIVIYHHMGWARLSNKAKHIGNVAQAVTYDNGYYESGLGFNNLVKYKLFGKLYGGLGMSFFYRYGAHQNEGGFSNNFAYRLTYVVRSL